MTDVSRGVDWHPTNLPPAGWRPDPSELETERYWDGTRWTPRVRDAVTLIERPATHADRPSVSQHRTPVAPPIPTRTPVRRWLIYALILAAIYSGTGWYGILPAWAPFNDVLVRAAPTGPSVSYPVFGSTDLETYIARHMIAQKPTIDLNYWATVEDASADQIFAAVSEAATQNPYVFAFQWSLSYSPVTASISPTYVYDAAEANQMRVEMALAVEMAVLSSGVTSDMSDADKAAAIHDFIVRTAQYDHAAAAAIEDSNGVVISAEIERSQEAYGILVDGKAVCTGYAKAFVLLAHAVGLESRVVTGWADGGVYSGSHAWNIVLIDGTWKVVDVTWNDYDSGSPGRDYFLLDEDHPLLATRTADN